MTTEYESPVLMERVKRPIDGDAEKVDYDMVEVTDAKSGKLLACCMMADDSGLERIADLLSSKRLWREANRFRQMVSDSRKLVRR